MKKDRQKSAIGRWESWIAFIDSHLKTKRVTPMEENLVKFWKDKRAKAELSLENTKRNLGTIA